MNQLVAVGVTEYYMYEDQDVEEGDVSPAASHTEEETGQQGIPNPGPHQSV